MDPDTPHRIAIVTDSTSDLPAVLVKQHGVTVMPQILIMGTQTWLDGIDIDPPAFYKLLQESGGFPSTSQPSIQSFVELFSRVAAGADAIVAVLVSAELSGTINSAQGAKAELPDIPIEIVDSRSASMGLGLIALATARAAETGGDLEAVAGVARTLVARTHIYFVVDTLEYLRRGGRIGAAAKLLGSALNLKPILKVTDGRIEPVTRIRSRRKAIEKLFELVQEQLPAGTRPHMAVLHVAAPEEAETLAGQLADKFQPVEMVISECGPVIGAHVGPGTVGVAFYLE